MVESASYVPDKGKYSELQVLQSGAGYYIGTIYHGEDFDEPGSRDSDYFPTAEAAAAYLAAINENEAIAEAGLMTRATP
jgi:hypothetical protein